MYKYYTKKFTSEEGIDNWLNSFQKDKPQGEYNYEIVGYVYAGDMIIITIRVHDLKE